MDLTPTPEQQRIIDIEDGAFLIVAPPGSGKTAVLTWRTLRLLRMQPVATWRLLALTFTTKAAQSLRTRIEEGLRADGLELRDRLRASTIHAFCLDVLQHYGELVAFPSPVSVYDEADRLAVLRRALVDDGLPLRDDAELKALLHEIAKAKRALTGPDHSWSEEDTAAFAAYDRALARQGACDYDDMLRCAWRLFSEQPRVARHYRRMYRYILVDEAQDTSRAQYMVLRALCGDEHRNVMLVADDRQAIYGFSGASTEYLDRFVDDFGAKRETLHGNFRCAAKIVEIANHLAHAMTDAPPAQMVATGSASGRARLVSCENESEEAAYIADWVTDLLEVGLPSEVLEPGEITRVVPEQVAILGRSRRNLKYIRHILEERNCEFVYNEGGRAAFEHRISELVVRGLRLVQNPRDEVTRGQLGDAWEIPGDLWSGLIQLGGTPERIARCLIAAKPDSDPTGLLDEMVSALAEEALSEAEEGELLNEEADSLREIVNSWKGRTAGQERSLGSFLADLAMASRASLERPGVRLLSIHAAKGLEFRAVAVAGWDDGSLPDFRSTSDAQVREERRNAYVAITRAARDLLLTWPTIRSTRFGARLQTPSRFLQEMRLIP